MAELITAMVTIFNDDLSVDYDACISLANFLIKNGSDGLVVSGTTGESPTLTDEEKLNLFARIKEAVGDRAKVIAGTGSNDTIHSINLTKKAERKGVDQVMIVTPYYNKPPQDGLSAHFRAIAASTSLPVILYNVPSRTSINLAAPTVINLAEVENIVAVKEASGDFAQIKTIIKNTADDFKVYSGDDAATFKIMKLGGNGIISVASHIIGNQIKEMLSLCVQGKINEADKLNKKLTPIFNALFKTTNPILVKAALEIIGRSGDKLRLPLIQASKQQKNELKSTLTDFGVV